MNNDNELTVIIVDLLRKIAEMHKSEAEARARLVIVESERDAAESERDAADARFAAIEGSTTWRLTAPFRALLDIARRTIGSSRNSAAHIASTTAMPMAESLRAAIPAESLRAAIPAESLRAAIPAIASIKDAFRDRCSRELDSFLAGSSMLALPASSAPQVSVLLVLHNQSELTFHCLQSLSRTLDYNSEVIILDNASTDRTAQLLGRLEGARVIRSPENLHFLRGVNRAAQEAKGRYILLLNNDTSVAPGAIAAASARLDTEPDLGAVGGPIVRLDGTLQEAGAIVWNDGHCQGYGQGRDPDHWEFGFRRDVDYCSGAFLMVRRTLFERLEGLDPAYAPAYFEETDLCMRIRAEGFRVAYEPEARIMHFEYGSSSNSDAPALFYKKNHEIFTERYKNVLKDSHWAPQEGDLQARMRKRTTVRVLVIDVEASQTRDDGHSTLGRKLSHPLLDAGFFVTYCSLASTAEDRESIRIEIPKEIEVAILTSLDEFMTIIHERRSYYDFILIENFARNRLLMDKLELIKNYSDSAVLIDIGSRRRGLPHNIP
jgi:GT2 family glycosyltransferase